jgi:hypothetical protein
MSQDGIFLPNRNNSNGMDIFIRVSERGDSCSISNKDGVLDSKQKTFIETSSENKNTYLIGIALKCHQSSSNAGVNCSVIKEKVAKFLYPVSSQLELEKNNITNTVRKSLVTLRIIKSRYWIVASIMKIIMANWYLIDFSLGIYMALIQDGKGFFPRIINF